MPRVSVHAKKVFDLIWYNADIEQAKGMIKNLKDPLDIAFGKIWLGYFFLCFYSIYPALIELKEAEENTHINQDKFIIFLVHSLYLGYYLGWNSPIVDIKLAKKYFISFQKFYFEIEYVDEWERFFSQGWYYFILANYVNFIENNLEKGIEYQRKSKEAWKFVPNDGEFLHKFFGNICVGYFLRLAGQFDEAEKLFLIALEESEKIRLRLGKFSTCESC